MKKFINFIGLIVITVLLTNCQVKLNNNKTLINEDIPSSIRKEINDLNSKVFYAIGANNPSSVKKLFSDKLLESGWNIVDSIFNVTSELIQGCEIKKLDEMFVVNANKNVSNTIMPSLSNNDGYILHYKALNKEVYISLNRILVGSSELLVTLIYGKTKDGWKIHHLRFGTYSIYGKTAIEYYYKAKNYESNGYLIDAATQLHFALQTLKPANQIWQYRKEKEILNLQQKVMAKINDEYNFPITIEKLATKPQIYHVYPEFFDDGYETVIKYYSQIDLKDTVKLKEENFLIRNEIGNIFKGIDKEKKYLLYKATNDFPDGTYRQIPIYGFVQEFK